MRDALCLHLRAYQFTVLLSATFKTLKKVSRGRLYGCPLHCVVKHMPEMYRCVSLRSIVAEAAERLFHQFR